MTALVAELPVIGELLVSIIFIIDIKTKRADRYQPFLFSSFYFIYDINQMFYN